MRKPAMAIHRAQANQFPAADTKLVWGLSMRLPRWNAFDGRRSQIAPTWARPENADGFRTRDTSEAPPQTVEKAPPR
jgi:hypothetical protein